MFNIGDLVVGNNLYFYTNEKALCVVIKPCNTEGNIWVTVIASGYNASRLGGVHFDLPLNVGSSFTYEVTEELFTKMESISAFYSYMEEKGISAEEIIKPMNFNEILIYYNLKKEGENLMTEIKKVAPVINLNGKYRFTEENREYFFAKAKELFKEFGEFTHLFTDKGLQAIWDEFVKNKSGLAYLLSMHPKWNPEKMAIVFESDYHRVRNANDINRFINWCYDKLEEYLEKEPIKVNCCTFSEINDAWRKLDRIVDLMADLQRVGRGWGDRNNSVTFEGMTYEEVVKEKHRIEDIQDMFKSDNVYYCGNYYKKDAYNKYMNARTFLELLRGYENHVADEEFAKKANELAEPFNFVNSKGKVKGLGAVAGQKVSRIVSRFFKNYGFDKIKEMKEESYMADGRYDEAGNYIPAHLVTTMKDYGWNKKFAEFADAINPLNIKRWTLISVNPIDYLTMSFGNGWASCHTIDKENLRDADGNYSGCYCSGTLSYMLDKTTLIMYTVHADYTGDDFCLQDKMNRCTFYLDEDKMVQGRLYPDGREADRETSMAGQFRAIMQKVIADAVKENNLWTVLKGTRECEKVTISHGTHYRDYTHYSDCNVSYLNRGEVERNVKPIHIGHNPICPSCGEEHSSEEWVTCRSCRRNIHTCSHCGALIPNDGGVYDEDTERWYCDSYCAEQEDVCYCENVDSWHSDYDNIYTDDYSGEAFYDDGWTVDTIHIEDCHYVSEENAENDGWHEVNGEWYHENNGEIVQCLDCDEWILVEDATEIEGGYYCSDCARDHEENDEIVA